MHTFDIKLYIIEYICNIFTLTSL